MTAHTAVMAEHLTPSQLIAEPDAAAYMGYTVSALRAWRRFNRGPAYVRVGRSVRYLPSDIEAWLAKNRVETRESRTTEAA